tara:strand:+ start:2418 stop:3200 length:783 start_codon:yes stop_codon:yes gene_type:complete
MNAKTPILIYTHSDYSFVWPALIGQFEKYVKDVDVYFGYNDTLLDISNYNIPSNWILHTYTDNTIWTSRVNELLKKIESDYVLFIHEDWIPTNYVHGHILDDMTEFMDEYNCGFLLSYINPGHPRISERLHDPSSTKEYGIQSKYDGYYFYKEDSHIFQPALWNRSVFEEFTEKLKKEKNQNEDRDCLAFMRNKNTYSIQGDTDIINKRTTTSLFFPHMHTLSEGLWNFGKYASLKQLLNSYGIDTDSRGVHTWWALDWE